LAFQDKGFAVAQQYTFQIDCRLEVEKLWDAMHFKTRQHIRKAEKKYTAQSLDDPAMFTGTYLRNLKAHGKTNLMDFDRFPALFAECRARDCGRILAAYAEDGSAAAMMYLVWSSTTMYYLLSTRRPDAGDGGSINMLLWSAMKFAHERGLIFDLDGVYSSGAARFLSGYGGEIKSRLSVRRSNKLFGAWQYLKQSYAKHETAHFA
jgi:lipid II:glycine glycyltransferase (peptidoglycan interpeptide bridge formation enzyme)